MAEKRVLGYEKEIGMWNSVFRSSCAVRPVLVLLDRERQSKAVLGLSGDAVAYTRNLWLYMRPGSSKQQAFLEKSLLSLIMSLCGAQENSWLHQLSVQQLMEYSPSAYFLTDLTAKLIFCFNQIEDNH